MSYPRPGNIDEPGAGKLDQDLGWWLKELTAETVLIALAKNSNELAKEKERRDLKSSRFDKILAMWSRFVGGRVGRVHSKPAVRATFRWMEDA